MLRPVDNANFETLNLAFETGSVALLEVRRIEDQRAVAAICAVNQIDRGFEITPFAILIEGNPFDLFDPPNPDGGFNSEGEMQ